MKLYIPTKICVGKGCVRQESDAIAALGNKAMIVTGRHSSRKNGSLQDVEAALKDRNVPYVIFDEIEENPSVETVVKAAEIAVGEKVDFFVAVGGGSPMDASKAISLLTKNPDRILQAEKTLYTAESLKAFPVAAVPTTSGTGSEVTPYAILTLHKNKTKKSMAHKVFPELALIDYGYLKTSTHQNMANTCVDALAHLIESYLNVNSNVCNRLYSTEGLRVWGSVKQELLAEGELSDHAYETFMRASLLAGMAIAHTGTSLPHGLSYPVTYEEKVPHGKAVGIFLPGFLEKYEDKNAVKEVLDFLGFGSILEIKDYLEKLLGEVEIPQALWERDVHDLLANPAKLRNYPYTVTEEMLRGYRLTGEQ